MIEVRSPVPQFFDTDGKPLDGGQILVGYAGVSAEADPRAIFWDQAGTLAAPQPVSTINGFPARNGSPTKFYTGASDYSITVKNKKGIVVFSSLHANSGVFEELQDASGSTNVGFDGSLIGNAAYDDVSSALVALHQRDNTLEAEIALSRVTPASINLFANGAFLVNQRAYASGTPTTVANQYTLDRIRVVTSGQSISFGPATTTIGNYIIAPANGAEQVIEGNRIAGGDYACYWRGSGTITVNGTPRAKNETFALTAGANATIRMFGEIEGMQVTRPEMIQSVSQNEFQYDFHQDLMLCRRYYEYGEYVEFSGNVTSGGAYYARATFSTRKRANPTITLTNFGTPSGFGATSGTAALITTLGFTEERIATGTGVGRFISSWTANAEL